MHMHLSVKRSACYVWRMSDGPSESVVGAWVRLVRAEQTVLAAVEADLKSAGFPPLAWYDVLLELAREAGGALRPLEIERRVLLAQYNLSRLVDRLEEARLVARQPCPEDRRGQLVRLTPAGRRLQQRMWPAYAAAIQRHVGERLSDKEAATLALLLDKLVSDRAPGP
jgi:DNA-binding MarR family transcriptional regulator